MAKPSVHSGADAGGDHPHAAEDEVIGHDRGHVPEAAVAHRQAFDRHAAAVADEHRRLGEPGSARHLIELCGVRDWVDDLQLTDVDSLGFCKREDFVWIAHQYRNCKAFLCYCGRSVECAVITPCFGQDNAALTRGRQRNDFLLNGLSHGFHSACTSPV